METTQDHYLAQLLTRTLDRQSLSFFLRCEHTHAETGQPKRDICIAIIPLLSCTHLTGQAKDTHTMKDTVLAMHTAWHFHPSMRIARFPHSDGIGPLCIWPPNGVHVFIMRQITKRIRNPIKSTCCSIHFSLTRFTLLMPWVIWKHHPPVVLERRLRGLQHMSRAATPLSSIQRLDLHVGNDAPRDLVLLHACPRLVGPARAPIARHRLRAHIGTSHGRASTGAKQASI